MAGASGDGRRCQRTFEPLIKVRSTMRSASSTVRRSSAPLCGHHAPREFRSISSSICGGTVGLRAIAMTQLGLTSSRSKHHMVTLLLPRARHENHMRQEHLTPMFLGYCSSSSTGTTLASPAPNSKSWGSHGTDNRRARTGHTCHSITVPRIG